MPVCTADDDGVCSCLVLIPSMHVPPQDPCSRVRGGAEGYAWKDERLQRDLDTLMRSFLKWFRVALPPSRFRCTCEDVCQLSEFLLFVALLKDVLAPMDWFESKLHVSIPLSIPPSYETHVLLSSVLDTVVSCRNDSSPQGVPRF